jgi:hypothetical protein
MKTYARTTTVHGKKERKEQESKKERCFFKVIHGIVFLLRVKLFKVVQEEIILSDFENCLPDV